MYNFLTHQGYNKAHKEAIQTWLNSCMKQIVVDVAAARGLTHKQVTSLPDFQLQAVAHRIACHMHQPRALISLGTVLTE